MMLLKLVTKILLISLILNNANAAVLSKEKALEIVKTNIASVQLPAQVVMAIMVISAELDTTYSEDPNNPLKTMQGIMGMTCVLAKKIDSSITDSNCITVLHDPNKSTALGIKVLSGYYSECYATDAETAKTNKTNVNLNDVAYCTFKRWYGKGVKSQQAYGSFKTLALVFTKTVKK